MNFFGALFGYYFYNSQEPNFVIASFGAALGGVVGLIFSQLLFSFSFRSKIILKYLLIWCKFIAIIQWMLGLVISVLLTIPSGNDTIEWWRIAIFFILGCLNAVLNYELPYEAIRNLREEYHLSEMAEQTKPLKAVSGKEDNQYKNKFKSQAFFIPLLLLPVGLLLVNLLIGLWIADLDMPILAMLIVLIGSMISSWILWVYFIEKIKRTFNEKLITPQKNA